MRYLPVLLAVAFAVWAAMPAHAQTEDRVARPDPAFAENLPAAIAALDSARTAAAGDRHRDAIRLYQRAIALHPAYESEIAVELGHQYTWNGNLDDARRWYEIHLRHHPDDVEARVGLARVVSWRDDHDEAQRLYEAVLAKHPDHLDALLGRAQVTNWSGRNREATWLYSDILRDRPASTEARTGLARAYQWGGRPDWAREVIAEVRMTPSLAAVLTDIDRERAFRGSYTYDRNQDSDDIERENHTFRAGVGADDVTRVSAEYGFATYAQPLRPEVSRDWVAGVLERRFSEYVAASVTAGYQWNDYDRAALPATPVFKDGFDLFTIDGYITLLPHDWTRIDVGVFHGSLQNPDAIYRGISLTDVSGGLDLRLRTNLLWVTALDVAWYSDDNTRTGAGTRLEWQPLWRAPIGVQHRFTTDTGAGYFGFARTTDNGYYDPRQYLSVFEQLAVDVTFSRRLSARLALRGSLEKENGDDWFTAGSLEASARWAVWRGLGLSAGYYNSESRLGSREGYQADGVYVTLDYLHW